MTHADTHKGETISMQQNYYKCTLHCELSIIYGHKLDTKYQCSQYDKNVHIRYDFDDTYWREPISVQEL